MSIMGGAGGVARHTRSHDFAKMTRARVLPWTEVVGYETATPFDNIYTDAELAYLALDDRSDTAVHPKDEYQPMGREAHKTFRRIDSHTIDQAALAVDHIPLICLSRDGSIADPDPIVGVSDN